MKNSVLRCFAGVLQLFGRVFRPVRGKLVFCETLSVAQSADEFCFCEKASEKADNDKPWCAAYPPKAATFEHTNRLHDDSARSVLPVASGHG